MKVGTTGVILKSYFNGARIWILFACFFFLSGFCSLLYETIWLRLAFAHFGVITPVVSVVVSVFMLGLGLGAWLSGELTKRCGPSFSPFVAYGLIELVIGCGALAVPALYDFFDTALLAAGSTNSTQYLLLSAVAIALSILPWSCAMGATLPMGMAALQRLSGDEVKGSFSFLYQCNAWGAALGSVASVLVLIELFGLRGALYQGAVVNWCVAALVFLVAGFAPATRKATFDEVGDALRENQPQSNFMGMVILFATGFISMAAEVVWTRGFAPLLGTVVYSFASLLAVYLVSTAFGAFLYRLNLKNGQVKSTPILCLWAIIDSLIPLVANDPRLPWHASAIAPLSVAPFCAVLGYLTPMLVDKISAGQPRAAGIAYAINTAGCIAGPLVAGYLLVPALGVKYSLIALSIPLCLLAVAQVAASASRAAYWLAACTASFVVLSLFCNSVEDFIVWGPKELAVKRDYGATVLTLRDLMNVKRLMVNGVSMTAICDETTAMAHLPSAFHEKAPEKVLVICFGMGTTFRGFLSWKADVTAVELLPSVVKSFSYFWNDAAQQLANPKGRIIVDDGRRFLRRTSGKYDVIAIDSPPPLQSVGNSLLFSVEFYTLAKKHLNPGGILLQWFPAPFDNDSMACIANSLSRSFPHIRGFMGPGGGGMFMLCSESSFADLSPEKILQKMPPEALANCGQLAAPGESAEAHAGSVIRQIMAHPVQLDALLAHSKRLVTDEHPVIEYYWLWNLAHGNK